MMLVASNKSEITFKRIKHLHKLSKLFGEVWQLATQSTIAIVMKYALKMSFYV